MKLVICALLFAAPVICLRADDLFFADGKKTVVRTLVVGGKTLQNVQLGIRTPSGAITIHHSRGVTKCSERELPEMWVKAIARREAKQLNPAKNAPSTIEGASREAAYERLVGQLLQEATHRAVKPVPVYEEKKAGGFFNGSIIAGRFGEFLICDGKTAAWVEWDYFKNDRLWMTAITAANSPELHADERQEAMDRAKKQALKVHPDRVLFQEIFIEREMEAWDRLHPAPKTADAVKEVPKGIDPFSGR